MLAPVLSLDTKKVRLVIIDNRVVVEKQTSEKEYQQIVIANNYLQNRPMKVSKHGLMVKIAPVVEWSKEKSLLTTTYCHGVNGEMVLRKTGGCQRLDWLSLFRQFLLVMRENGFLWGDCAPRNIIIDIEEKLLWLVDFERNFQIADSPVEKYEFSRHIGNYAREEFSCFLFDYEQRSFFLDIIEEDRDGSPIFLSKVSSKRKASLLVMRFGRKEIYFPNELRQVEDIMASIATPFEINGGVFFPMYIIDQITNKKGAETYASIATLLYDARSPKEKLGLLERMAASG